MPLTSLAGALRGEVVDPIADARWTALLAEAGDVSAFHHPAWMTLLRERFGHSISACCLVGPDGAIRAGLPIALMSSRLTGRRLVALPFSDHCPPLRVGSNRALDAALAGELDRLRRGMGLDLDVRGPVDGSAGAEPVARFHHHVLALDPDVGVVERGFRRSQALRGARRAVREGLAVERRTDAEALAAFYGLHLATRRRLGVPCHPRRYILALARLFARGLGFTMLVRDAGRPVAGGVFLTHGGTVTYKHGASDQRFQNKRPNNLLFLETIRWACEQGFAELDFGRTDIGHEGLRSFKLSWGADERLLAYWRFSDPESAGRRRELRVSPRLLRRSPAVVSRLVGEVLYRHVG